jgi:hypothetical protein
VLVVAAAGAMVVMSLLEASRDDAGPLAAIKASYTFATYRLLRVITRKPIFFQVFVSDQFDYIILKRDD